jgi:hypothetical protein
MTPYFTLSLAFHFRIIGLWIVLAACVARLHLCHDHRPGFGCNILLVSGVFRIPCPILRETNISTQSGIYSQAARS